MGAPEVAQLTSQDKLQITKERLKAWSACSDGYRWFLEKFPQGGEFGDVYDALRDDKRLDDAGWLVERVFADLDTGEQVRQTVRLTGAVKDKIEALVKEGAEAATTGYRANAATTGNGANAATTGYRANAATTGKHAVAASLGMFAKAKAGAGGAIVLARRNGRGELLGVFSSMVGENGIEADTWYELGEAGNPVAVDVEADKDEERDDE